MKPTHLLLAVLLTSLGTEAAPTAKTPPAKPEKNTKPAVPDTPKVTLRPGEKQATPPPRAVPVPEPLKLPATARGYNRMVIDAIRRMPTGGGYSANSTATSKLVEASAITPGPKGGLGFKPTVAQPSYCSGATYLVFLEVVNELVTTGKLKLTKETAALLPVTRQLDGAGIWGRWNANGPGTGRLFFEAKLGTNIPVLNQAEPGDFLKIWWNEHVGKKERGHSVIFLGHETTEDGEPGIRFWSANEPEGMSSKVVPLTRIKRALVSRLEHPENINQFPKLAPKDSFLASMLEKDATEEEYMQSIGLAAKESSSSPQPDGGEKIVVRLDGVPSGPDDPAGAPGTAKLPADPATAFMAGSPYASYTSPSKAGIIQLIQMRLRYEGLYSGPVDGKAGETTISGLKEWQKLASIEPTGLFDIATQLKMGLNGLGESKNPAPAAPSAANGASSRPATAVPLRRN